MTHPDLPDWKKVVAEVYPSVQTVMAELEQLKKEKLQARWRNQMRIAEHYRPPRKRTVSRETKHAKQQKQREYKPVVNTPGFDVEAFTASRIQSALRILAKLEGET